MEIPDLGVVAGGQGVHVGGYEPALMQKLEPEPLVLFGVSYQAQELVLMTHPSQSAPQADMAVVPLD